MEERGVRCVRGGDECKGVSVRGARVANAGGVDEGGSVRGGEECARKRMQGEWMSVQGRLWKGECVRGGDRSFEEIHRGTFTSHR